MGAIGKGHKGQQGPIIFPGKLLAERVDPEFNLGASVPANRVQVSTRSCEGMPDGCGDHRGKIEMGIKGDVLGQEDRLDSPSMMEVDDGNLRRAESECRRHGGFVAVLRNTLTDGGGQSIERAHD